MLESWTIEHLKKVSDVGKTEKPHDMATKSGVTRNVLCKCIMQLIILSPLVRLNINLVLMDLRFALMFFMLYTVPSVLIC
ncbi:hypothetical protein BRADI_2g05885v3 [Brachypodium distachyon]|uniref:Uncharacterized protein n=1 Tax=Brachypodium distachyon TaxID=15368 RepID=A0A2K2D756_BRADI|nr:hypothetical protein BRADI_2g05885v3 [Brachypodium distachyon]